MILNLNHENYDYTADNICMEKVWVDYYPEFFELKIKCYSEYVTVYNTSYVTEDLIKDFYDCVTNFVASKATSFHFGFGQKDPDFSMNVEMDTVGKLKIEIDMKIGDSTTSKHRCAFYIFSELGLLESFANNLQKLITGDIGETVVLNPVD